MMTRYHLSPTVGPAKCSAEYRCEFADESGNEPEHYYSLREAETAYEKALARDLGLVSTVSVPGEGVRITEVIKDKKLFEALSNPELEDLAIRRDSLLELAKERADSTVFENLPKKQVLEELKGLRARISEIKDGTAIVASEVFQGTVDRDLVVPKGFESLGQFESNSPMWLSLRQKTLGGSEVGSILGLKGMGARNSISRFKLEEIDLSGDVLTPKFYGGAARRGVLWEPALVALASDSLGEQVYTNKGTFSDGVRHVNMDGFTVNDDGTVKAVVECKTSNDESAWEGGKVPPGYVLQVQHYMDVLGVDTAWVAVNIDDRFFKIVKVSPNDRVESTDLTRELYPELGESFSYSDAKPFLVDFVEEHR